MPDGKASQKVADPLSRNPIQMGSCQKWTTERFQTYLTGELYAVLRCHYTLGRLMPSSAHIVHDDEIQTDAFEAGPQAEKTNPQDALSHKLFDVRTIALTKKLATATLTEIIFQVY